MRAVILAVAVAAAAADRAITSHDVVFSRADGPTPGAEVVDARGALLAPRGLSGSVLVTLASSGVIVVGVYAALHMFWAASRALARTLRSARVVERAVFSRGDPDVALARIHDAIVWPGWGVREADAFMPSNELGYLTVAAVASTIANGSVAAWIARRDRVPRIRARIASAVAWFAVAGAVVAASF